MAVYYTARGRGAAHRRRAQTSFLEQRRRAQAHAALLEEPSAMKTFFRVAIGTAMLVVSIAVFAATAHKMDAAHSNLSFTATQSGGNFEGRFGKFTADIVFADNDLANSRFDVFIDMKSVDTGDDQ